MFGLGQGFDLFELLLDLRRRPALAGGLGCGRGEQGLNRYAQRAGDLGQGSDADANGAALEINGVKSMGSESFDPDSVFPSQSQSYVYDDLGRLTSATSSSGNRAFTYDATGNRLTHTLNNVTTNYAMRRP